MPSHRSCERRRTTERVVRTSRHWHDAFADVERCKRDHCRVRIIPTAVDPELYSLEIALRREARAVIPFKAHRSVLV